METKPQTPPASLHTYHPPPIRTETPPIPTRATSRSATHDHPEPPQSPEHPQQEKNLHDLTCTETPTVPAPEQVLSHEIQYLTGTPLYYLTKGPAPVDCPACGKRGVTKCTTEIGSLTHMWGVLACFFCCLGCIPYCIKSLKDVKHNCSHCGTLLAVWHRGGRVADVMVHPTNS